MISGVIPTKRDLANKNYLGEKQSRYISGGVFFPEGTLAESWISLMKIVPRDSYY